MAITNELAIHWSNTSRLKFHKDHKSIHPTAKKRLCEVRSLASNNPMLNDISMEELDHTINEFPRNHQVMILFFAVWLKN